MGRVGRVGAEPIIATSVALFAAIGSAGLYGVLTDSSNAISNSAFESPATLALLTAITGIDVLIFSLAPRVRNPEFRLAAFGLSLALATAATELRQAYPVGSDRAFPQVFTRHHLNNFNLVESLYSGQNLLRGQGNTLPVADGSTQVDTYRMPGYPLFVAASAVMFRSPPDDLAALAASTVYLQVMFFALAVAFLAFSLARYFPASTVALLVALTCWYPQSLDLTQSDSVILPCGLLISGTLCLVHRKSTAVTEAPLRYHLLLHSAFALYFLMRSDISVGWAGVSLVLYWRRWRYMLIPVCFFLAIGSVWGLYKKAHGSAFVMTTSNVGHVGFVGLWQVPSHRFVWQPTDESYVGWIERYGYRYMEPRANDFAIKEVVRFWLTYPGFIVSNFVYKFHAFFRANVWTGSLALRPAEAIGQIMRRVLYWLFLFAILVALITRFEVRRTILMGWPILFNLPLFCLLQYNPRYTPFIACSVMFAAVPLLLCKDFYRRVTASKRRAAMLVIAVTLLFLIASRISRVLSSDEFRYWTPLLDPSKSTLNVLK